MQKTKTAFILAAVALSAASCGSFFPDKLWYPVDEAPAKKEQKAQVPAKAAPAAEKPAQPAKPAQPEEQSAPLEEGDAVIVGEAPKA